MRNIPLFRMFLFAVLCSVFLFFISPKFGAIGFTVAFLCLVVLAGKLMFVVYGSAAGTNGFTFYRLFLFLITSGINFFIISAINGFAGMATLATIFSIIEAGAFIIAVISLLIAIFRLFFL